MKINIDVKQSNISFGPVKALLKAVNYVVEKPFEITALKVLNPLNYNRLDYQDKVSLTDAAEFKDQIRFATKDRIERSLANISEMIMKKVDKIEVNIFNSINLDQPSRNFFEILSRNNKTKIVFYLKSDNESKTTSYVQTSSEEELEKLILLEKLTDDEYKKLTGYFEKYINCGDLWTSENILNQLEKQKPTPFVYNMKGLVYTLLDQPIESEYYYLKWKSSGSTLDAARANYSISMLYLRHHPKHLKSPVIGEEYLENAFELLNKVEDISKEQLEFEKVFNRNGYALYLFQIGKVDEAIEMLKDGIEKLNGENKILLHKTVLMYNLAQCYSRLGHFDKAIDTYNQVIHLDPFFPEYHAELGKCYLETGDFSKAIKELEYALELNPMIGELNSLLGFCYQEIEELPKSLNYFKAAYLRNPEFYENMYNFSYSLNENNLYQEAHQILSSYNFENGLTELMMEDYFSLLAEVLIKVNKRDEALKVLNKGLEYAQNSKQLIENINEIEKLYEVNI